MSQRRKKLYSKEQLLPQTILQTIPYKQTHQALQNESIDELKKLLCSFAIKLAKDIWMYKWDKIKEKEEKKLTLKAMVYLDALITLYRMPNSFEFSMADLSERFRGLSEEILEQILDKFCKVTVSDRNDDRFRKNQKPSGGSDFTFMKSKEDTKLLILHIIGVTVTLSASGAAKGSFIGAILKKDISELKSFCTELGLHVEPFKSEKVSKSDGKKVVTNDLLISFDRRKPVIKEPKPEESQADKTEEKTE